MSEYTPTDAEIEGAWVSRYDGEHTGASGSELRAYEAEFDRWLTAHDKSLREQVAKEIEARRDRFIDRAATMYEWGLPAQENAYLNGLDDAIDIARGEDQADE